MLLAHVSHVLSRISCIEKRCIVFSEYKPDLPVLQLYFLLSIIIVSEPHECHALLLAHVKCACAAAVAVPVPPHIDVFLFENSLDHSRIELYFAPVLEGLLELVVKEAPEKLFYRDILVKSLQREVQVFRHVLSHILYDTSL